MCCAIAVAIWVACAELRLELDDCRASEIVETNWLEETPWELAMDSRLLPEDRSDCSWLVLTPKSWATELITWLKGWEDVPPGWLVVKALR